MIKTQKKRLTYSEKLVAVEAMKSLRDGHSLLTLKEWIQEDCTQEDEEEQLNMAKNMLYYQNQANLFIDFLQGNSIDWESISPNDISDMFMEMENYYAGYYLDEIVQVIRKKVFIKEFEKLYFKEGKPKRKTFDLLYKALKILRKERKKVMKKSRQSNKVEKEVCNG